MATEAIAAPVAAPPEQKGAQPAVPSAAASAAPTDAPQLTPAQLKAKAKAEKAARRAQVKEVKAAVAAAASQPQPGADAKGGKGKGKQEGTQPPQGQQGPGKSGLAHRPSMTGRRPSILIEKDIRGTIPECFSHLPMAKRIPLSQAHKDVHPAVLTVGQEMATFAIKDSISRLQATLLAFRKVIESYETPKGNSLSRHFVPHVLNPQIEYLTECRPMCFSMGNAIRLLKTKVNSFDIDTPEDEAKEGLIEMIDQFIRDRITLAQIMIKTNAAKQIEEGDVVLTYGNHPLVEKTLLHAKSNGKSFSVIIVDDPYERGGQVLAASLRDAGIRVVYSPNLGGLKANLQQATQVLFGAEAIFANGAVHAAAGTADIAVAAAAAGKKVFALCETINYDRERISVDSLTYNEIDPEHNSPESLRLLFDTTRDKYVTAVISEHETTGNSPTQAILAFLRKNEDLAVN